MKKKARDCKCTDCRAACEQKPGWFAFGEAELVAKHLEMSLKDLFTKYLMVDWWVDEPNVFLLSPAIKGYTPGSEFPGNPRGQCVSYKNKECSIHAVKPKECREALGCDPATYENGLHASVKDTWNNEAAQAQIRELLNRDPEAEDYSIFDMLGFSR